MARARTRALLFPGGAPHLPECRTQGIVVHDETRVQLAHAYVTRRDVASAVIITDQLRAQGRRVPATLAHRIANTRGGAGGSGRFAK